MLVSAPTPWFAAPWCSVKLGETIKYISLQEDQCQKAVQTRIALVKELAPTVASPKGNETVRKDLPAYKAWLSFQSRLDTMSQERDLGNSGCSVSLLVRSVLIQSPADFKENR